MVFNGGRSQQRDGGGVDVGGGTRSKTDARVAAVGFYVEVGCTTAEVRSYVVAADCSGPEVAAAATAASGLSGGGAAASWKRWRSELWSSMALPWSWLYPPSEVRFAKNPDVRLPQRKLCNAMTRKDD